MSEIPLKLKAILDEFSEIDDLDIKTELLIELGEKFVPVPESVATRPYPECNKVNGCESEAYLFTETNSDGTLNFFFAVENPQGISAKAMAYILTSTLNGENLELVSQISEDLAYKFFGKGLSMGKGLGLTGMVKKVKEVASSRMLKIN